MMDWYSSERHDAFKFVRVDRNTFEDTVVLDNIVGSTIRRDSMTALKASASIDYLGQLDIENDFVRVYSISEVQGQTNTVVHGTFLVSTPESEVTDKVTTGTATLYSLLHLLSEQYIALPMVIPKGKKVLNWCTETLKSFGLNVVADPSDAELGQPKVLEGITYLEATNDLLEFAGFRSLDIDGMGNVLMRAYRDPSTLTPSVVFKAGPDSTFAPSVGHLFDTFSVPNRLQLTCSRPDEPPIVAVVVNDDPFNRYSTASRGRVIDAEPEEVDDILNETTLAELAKAKLMAKTSAVESCEVTHTYEPFEMDECCLIDFNGFQLQGMIVSSETSLVPGMLCSTKIQRTVRF
jgi:hypothetical protein